MTAQWFPKRSLLETDKILTKTGSPFETVQAVVEGRVIRVYKNAPPNIGRFWLAISTQHKDKPCIVYEDERYTYGEIAEKVSRMSAYFRDVHGIRKGDVIGLVSRNYPEWAVIFWTSQIMGVTISCINAWLQPDTIKHCIVKSQCKIVILDAERASLLEPLIPNFEKEEKTQSFLVLRSHQSRKSWQGMRPLDDELARHHCYLSEPADIPPDHDSCILFTSGTTGKPKGALLTHRALCHLIMNVPAASTRHRLREGQPLELLVDTAAPQKALLFSAPLFHVTGLAFLMFAAAGGAKVVMLYKWDMDVVTRLLKKENITHAGGVPSMVMDLLDSPALGHPLESLIFGGAPSHDGLPREAAAAFPDAMPTQGYGLTESGGLSVACAGGDYRLRPASIGLPCPVNDVLIVKNNGIVAATGELGEIWLKGPNNMKAYVGEPETTAQTLTKDGWLKTGDIGVIDTDGFVYVRDRAKDIIIRGGENIDSISVENGIYADERILEAAVVGVPDKRLGELVSAVIYPKAAHRGQVTEEDVIERLRSRSPKFAVPVMVLVADQPLERNAAGKILKEPLRRLARTEWGKRALNPAVAKM